MARRSSPCTTSASQRVRTAKARTRVGTNPSTGSPRLSPRDRSRTKGELSDFEAPTSPIFPAEFHPSPVTASRSAYCRRAGPARPPAARATDQEEDPGADRGTDQKPDQAREREPEPNGPVAMTKRST